MSDDRIDLFSQFSELYERIWGYVWTPDFFVQSILIFLAVVASLWLAKITQNIPSYGSPLLESLKNNKKIKFKEVSFYVFCVGFLWFEQSVIANLIPKPTLITVTMLVIFFWSLARLSFIFVRHSVQARAIIFIGWIVIFLALFGSNSPTIDMLKEANLCIADYHFSLLFLIEAIMIFTILLWGAQYLSETSSRHINASKSISPSYKVLYTKLSRIGLFTLAGLLGLTLLGIDITLLAVFSGALGLGLGIGLQRIFANFISGIILLLDKSIKPGDSLEVDGFRGTVDYMNARYVSIATADGKNILIPNESMITEKVHNWTYETTALQIKVSFMVEHGSDLNLVQKLSEDVLAKNTDIHHEPEPSCLIGEFTEIGVRYDLRCWLDGANVSVIKVKHNLLMGIWEALSHHQINLAQNYPDYAKKA
ncbi:MAG: mechanosensitive ion channel [Alphaproteobacteria bacterium]|nr:mechanosensitive ion channel [Alphaproteobacteria bacterium]